MKIRILACFVALGAAIPLLPQVAVRQQGFVPFSDEPIRYLSDDLHDPVANLNRALETGSAALEYEPKHGYLDSVLQRLGIPVSSQTLVFSKTSFQFRKISPKTPRAIYFNDDVYVAWVQEGKAVEVASFDPMQGAIFYLLEGKKVERPSFKRAELDCTQCHVAASTRGVPGVMLRSIYPSPSGTQAPQTEGFTTGHESPLRDRWGGWYVTGTHGAQRHMGNAVVDDPEHPDRLDRDAGANVKDLSRFFDVSAYLSPHSDIVAHLVLAHQTQMHNMITRTNFQTRIAIHEAKGGEITQEMRKRYEEPAEALVRYLLFADEAPLAGAVAGDSTFAAEFSGRGPRDPKGRSLRDFDLRTRLFKYSCSYLVYSEAFDSIPSPAKDYIYGRLFDILKGRDTSAAFSRLSRAERDAIFEILLATKPGLPEAWLQNTDSFRTTRAPGKPATKPIRGEIR